VIPGDTRTILEKIAMCFRFQHPEQFERAMVDVPALPPGVQYGPGNHSPSDAPSLPEPEPITDVVPLVSDVV
jgi:hypothetical protein